MTVRKSLAQQEEYRVRDTDGDREPREIPDRAWMALVDDLHAEFDQGHMRVAVIVDRHRPNIEAALLARPRPADPNEPWTDETDPTGLRRLLRATDADAVVVTAKNRAGTGGGSTSVDRSVLEGLLDGALLARRAPGDRDALLEAVAAIPFYPDATDGPVDVPPGTSRRLRSYRSAVLDALAADSRPEQPSAGWQRAIAAVRARVAAEPTLAWPGEIDDILDDLDSRPEQPAPLDVERLASALDAVMPGLRGETVACEHGSNDKRYWPLGDPGGDLVTPGDFAARVAAEYAVEVHLSGQDPAERSDG